MKKYIYCVKRFFLGKVEIDYGTLAENCTELHCKHLDEIRVCLNAASASVNIDSNDGPSI